MKKEIPFSSFSLHPSSLRDRLLTLLAHPNIASKHWIIRQYDHEVQGGSVIKPLVGPRQVGPSDASVFRPKLTSQKGVVISCGMAPSIEDPYAMALASIDEAVRNAVCVGGDPGKMAILDNFCWPSVDDEITMGTLVRACEACRDGALAYGIPFISGKDSLHNQFTNQETKEVLRIPRTLLISAIGVIGDVRKCITMDFKQRGSRVAWVRAKDVTNLSSLAAMHRTIADTIHSGKVLSCHDVSDGGVIVAAAEMAIASGVGLIVSNEIAERETAWDEQPGQYLMEFGDWNQAAELAAALGDSAEVIELGLTTHLQKLTFTTTSQRVTDISIDDLTKAWRGTLDW
jgi:phosphoribosylformylglycinamidine synthase